MDLEQFLDGQPAMAAAVVRSGDVEYGLAGAAGLDDRFHIGSNTKAMTATLAAIAVERGLLDWSASAAAVLDVEGSDDITLERLLAHAAGIRALTGDAEFVGLPSERGEVARLLLGEPPLFAPGTDNAYSNGGYAIAAALLEEVTGLAWESLLRTWLAEPLSIELGVGWPVGLVGHYERDGELVPHDHRDGFEVPAAIAPAGDVNATIGAYGSFVRLHLRGLRGQPELISPEAFAHLHAPIGDPFALGWGIQPWEGSRTSVHAGSAGTFYAVVALQPERDVAVAVLTNAGGQRAQAAAVEAARGLLRSHA